MRFSRPRHGVAAAACTLAAVLAASSHASAGADDNAGPEPVLSQLELTHPTIHAIGAEHTGVPKNTRLKLTLNVAATVRVRVKDVDPYGLSRVLDRDLPAGGSARTTRSRVALGAV